MATCMFRSPLALRLQAFWELRRASGRKAQNDGKILAGFDHFLIGEVKPGQAITSDIVQRWVASMDHLSVGTRINRLSILRQFCAYLRHFDQRTCIVHLSFFPHRTRPAPHIYSVEEVRSIMAAAKESGPAGSLRPIVITTLIGLLYATGLRIGEALRLTLADVDLRRKLLTVRETKFRKTRYVPLSTSTTRHLADYLRVRRRNGFSEDGSARVFLNSSGRPYGITAVYTIFLQILRMLKLRGPKGQRGPRLHDFRHTFAVNRLLAWYRHGENISAKLPLLSTYMGHTTVTCTEVYLHATAELLESVGKRFHDHFAVPPLSRKEAHHA
ncbi:MAG: tyrosine-type recombinase/integrase [Nitrospirae bacterium]|nr:tyrosine-type recombinase/integrase [Nitrospirota bacterium]